MPRSQENSNEFVAGMLPTIKFGRKSFYVDGRLKEMRNVKNFMDTLEDTDDVWEKLSFKDKSTICYEYHGVKLTPPDENEK